MLRPLSTALATAVAAALALSPVAVADPDMSTSPSAPPTTGSGAPETPGSGAPETEPSAPSDTREDDVAVASVHDFAVTATFDKASYATGEDMRITFAITNNGTTGATASASFFGQDPDLIRVRSEDEVSRVPIAAGETHTTTFTGSIGNAEVTTARLRAFVHDETGATLVFEFTVPVTPRFAHASGTAFEDRDGDNRADPGEELAGVTLTWQNTLHDASRFTVTTGADGTFSLPRLPTSTYFVSGTAPDGLLVGYRGITVGESGVDGLLFRVVRPLTDLAVDLEFTKETYRRDEAPTVRVTLTNKGDVPMTGILAYCNRSGGSQGLRGRSAGWGALAEGGVTIEPHSTLELDVTEPMPEGAYDYGRVLVGCDFGYDGVDEGNPSDYDLAEVPGLRGDIHGFVGHDGTGLADVDVVLVADDRCPIVAKATTGTDGRFTIEKAPVGEYDLYMFPPTGWRIEFQNPTGVLLVGSQPAQLYIEAAPGDAPAPELPEQPADCAAGSAPTTTTTAPPAPQGSAAPGLASTGASVAVPGAVGVLALLAGLGALLVTRRRGVS